MTIVAYADVGALLIIPSFSPLLLFHTFFAQFPLTAISQIKHWLNLMKIFSSFLFFLISS